MYTVHCTCTVLSKLHPKIYLHLLPSYFPDIILTMLNASSIKHLLFLNFHEISISIRMLFMLFLFYWRIYETGRDQKQSKLSEGRWRKYVFTHQFKEVTRYIGFSELTRKPSLWTTLFHILNWKHAYNTYNNNNSIHYTYRKDYVL